MARGIAASTSWTPTQVTLGQLQREVLNYISAPQNDDELNDLAKDLINAAISSINSRTWSRLFRRDDITTVTDQDEYDLPSDFKDPMRMVEINSDGNRVGRLHFLPAQRFFDFYQNQQGLLAGDPYHYTVLYSDRKILLSISPTTAWVSNVPTLYNYYFYRVPFFTSPGTSLTIWPEFREYIKWNARGELASIRSPGKAAYAVRQAERLFDDLKTDDNEQQTDWSDYV